MKLKCNTTICHCGIYYLSNLCVGQPTENNVAWQRFLPTGPIAMLPVLSALLTSVFLFLVNSPKKYAKLCPCSCTAAFRHCELSGVVNQPPARRGAARAGWRVLCWRYQLSLRKSFQPPHCWSINRQTHTCQGDGVIFLLVYSKREGFSVHLLMCLAVFGNPYKQQCHCFFSNWYNTNISLLTFFILEKLLFPILAIFTVHANEQGHRCWVTFGSRPGLLIKPVVSHCQPLLHGMFFKQS